MVEEEKEKLPPLPEFRGDIKIYRGPDESDGSPTYNLLDPITNTYFKITWAEASIIEHFRNGMSLPQLIKTVHEKTTLEIKEEEVVSFYSQLEMQGLLEVPKKAEEIQEKHEKSKPNWIIWFMTNYLFLKIPLVNPNEFLERTLKYTRPFLTPAACLIYTILAVWGFSLLVTQWGDFLYTFPYFFSLEGMIAYSAAIIGTKIIHEFAHAYTAKKYGLNIPTMGIALLVLWPVLYTDATDAWKLYSLRKRLTITAAGVISELALAGIATIGWSFTQPGILNSVFFIIASTNWISTMIVNLNPALRFDGYYLFSDLMGVENLQTRAFNLARREGYRLLFGILLPDPEPSFPIGKRIILCIYSVYTWIYRIFLYTAIALFVYYKFTKVLGIFLFFVEILIFFVWPVVSEMQYFLKIRPYLKRTRRLLVTTTLFITLVLWSIVPWPHRLALSAVTVPVEDQALYSLKEGKVLEVKVEKGDLVEPDQLLLTLESKENDIQERILEQELKILEKKLNIIQGTDELLPLFIETQDKMIQTEAELAGIQEKTLQSKVKATIGGKVYQWDKFLRPGIDVLKNQELGRIASTGGLNVICYVPDEEIQELSIGQEITFYPYRFYGKFSGKIIQIPPVRSEILDHPQLASTYGGDLPVLGTGEKPLTLVESFYPVLVELNEHQELKIGDRGEVVYTGPWRSHAMWLWDLVTSVFIKESGF